MVSEGERERAAVEHLGVGPVDLELVTVGENEKV
jgi:hypothetical protein